jgi:hypothetical protein
MTMKHHFSYVAIGVVLCALLAGCGDEDVTGSSSINGTYQLAEMTIAGKKTVPPYASGALTLADGAYSLWMSTSAYSGCESGTFVVSESTITLTSRSGFTNSGALSAGNASITILVQDVLAVFVKS